MSIPKEYLDSPRESPWGTMQREQKEAFRFMPVVEEEVEVGSIPALFDLSGRVAIVTGACGLLGYEHSDVLAEAGANVVLADLRIGACRNMAQDIATGREVKALAVEVDISDTESVEQMVRQVLEQFGRIDILVNNAALTVKGGTEQFKDYFTPLEDYPLEMWEKALRVNLIGAHSLR